MDRFVETRQKGVCVECTHARRGKQASQAPLEKKILSPRENASVQRRLPTGETLSLDQIRYRRGQKARQLSDTAGGYRRIRDEMDAIVFSNRKESSSMLMKTPSPQYR
jgi:hypothetical protein